MKTPPVTNEKRFRTTGIVVVLFTFVLLAAYFNYFLLTPAGVDLFLDHGKEIQRAQVLWLTGAAFFLLVLEKTPLVRQRETTTRAKNFFFFFLLFLAVYLPLFWGHVTLLWSKQLLHYSAINGYLPWSDARGYVRGMNSLVETGVLSDDWSCRRPPQHLLLGALSGIFNQQFELVIKSLVVLLSIATSFAAAALVSIFGVGGSLLFGTAMFLYASENFLGTTLSGNMGFLSGTLALTFLVLAVTSKSRYCIGVGFAFLSLGLVARPGALLILPFLLLVFSFKFRPFQFDYKSLMAAVIGTGAIVIGTTFQHQTLCENQGAAFSNTAMTLYGVVHGGQQWTFAQEQYPDWDKLTPDQYARLLYQASIDKLLSDPLSTWSGLKHGWKLYLKRDMPLWPAPYHHAERGLILLSILVSIVFFMRSGTASALGGLVIGSGLGIFFSAGFISIDGWARVYAATAPFYAFVIPFGISRPFNKLNTKKFLEPKRSLTKPIQYLGALILFGFFLSPRIALIGKTADFPSRTACKAGEIYAQQRHSPWQTVTIASAETFVAADWLKLSEKSLNLFSVHGDEQKFFSSLRSGQVIVLGTSLIDGILRFTVFDSMSERHMNSGLLEFCIRGRNPNSDWYFYDAYIPN